jgi:hypothetical protein
VLLLSARAGEESRIEGLNAGADDYLVKPFSAKELRARIQTNLQIGRFKAAEERERAKLSAVFAQAPVGIALLEGPEHVFAIANPVYCAADQEKLFQPFKRIDSGHPAGGPSGWGLGLILVKGIVEAHGGFVTVKSEVGTGTVSTVTLPLDSRSALYGSLELEAYQPSVIRPADYVEACSKSRSPPSALRPADAAPQGGENVSTTRTGRPPPLAIKVLNVSSCHEHVGLPLYL